VIVNRTTGHLVDGHLRAELALGRGDATIPVAYVELSPEEEDLILASLDPISAMAARDDEKLRQLLAEIEFDSKELEESLASLTGAIAVDQRDYINEPIPERYAVLVECEGETQQAELLERLTNEGLSCRALLS
jgi:ParB-like chromosome segregation protein Spo0J